MRRATASPRAGKKEAKDKAKREQQERQRAEDLKRKAKREREAARNRERDRRLALWDPARKACTYLGVPFLWCLQLVSIS